MSFEAFGLDARILAGVKLAGYESPTPIQVKSIPGIMEGHDLMGLAQTGTGKTAAFVLPMLHHMLSAHPSTDGTARKKIRGLIIAPTRELAEQINDSIKELGKKTPFKSMTIYGGASAHNQLSKLQKGVDIVVACPGRLLDHMGQGNVDLTGVEMLVLDEADRMLDMGFLPDITRIIKQLPKKRQTMLFSATMPDEIRKLTSQLMHLPVTVQVDHGTPAKTVSHTLYPVAEHLKTSLLIALLRQIGSGSVLVFTRTKSRTRRIAERLQKEGFNASPLQGDMTQGKRQESLDGFRSGKYQILVATDIAARGVDVLGISHVINYDMPDTSDAYTHRVGRTGRAERSGEAITLVTMDDKIAVQSLERNVGIELILRELEGFDYNVAAPPRSTAPRRPGGGSRRPSSGSPRGGSGGGRTSSRGPRRTSS